METLRQRLAEQQGRHQGGSKWIGTAGTSPSALWLQPGRGTDRSGQVAPSPRRQGLGQARIRDLDGDVELGTAPSSSPCARRWGARARPTSRSQWNDQRHGAQRRLARSEVEAGRQQSEGPAAARYRRFDGRPHRESAQLFSAAKSEFSIWRPSTSTTVPTSGCGARHGAEFEHWTPTVEVMNKYGPDWSLVLVGDATMKPL